MIVDTPTATAVAFVVAALLGFAWARVRYWKRACRDAERKAQGLLDRPLASMASPGERKLTALHPDWRTIIASAEFAAWARALPFDGTLADRVRMNADQIRDAIGAGKVIDAFKNRPRPADAG